MQHELRRELRFAQQRQVTIAVSVVEGALQAGVASLYHVLRDAGQDETGSFGQARIERAAHALHALGAGRYDESTLS